MSGHIRVAMISHGYHPRVGGAERQLGAIAPLLETRGAEVHVITRREGGLAATDTIDGVRVYRLPAPGSKAVASVAFTLAALPLLRRLRPNVIHAHELLSTATAAVAAKPLLGVPVVVTLHGGGAMHEVARLKRKPMGGARMAAYRRRVDVFVAVSRELDAALASVKVRPERRCLIPNGVDTDRFAPASPEYKLSRRGSLGLPDGLIVVYAGRLAPGKRLEHLVSVWPGVRAVHRDAVLLVVGKGDDEARLRAIARDGVRFVGEVDDVLPYLQAADVFALPSAAEGLSVALLEAMAAGLPCVATDVGGNPDVIDHGETGWLVPPETPSALFETLLMVLGDADSRARVAERARQRVIREYGVSTNVDRLLALYHRVIAASGPRGGRR